MIWEFDRDIVSDGGIRIPADAFEEFGDAYKDMHQPLTAYQRRTGDRVTLTREFWDNPNSGECNKSNGS